MKAIFKLLILNFLTLFIFPSCSDDDKSKSELNDPISGNISPVGSFAVEATNNENELLVKWTNPSNRDVDMVELSYRDVETSLSRATDFSPGHIIIQVERDVTQEYLLKVPYFATYEVSAVAISKAGKRSVPESRIMMPYHEKVDEPELKLPEMLDRAHSYMTSVIGYYFGKSSRSCWRGNYPYDGKGYWDGDALVWGQGGGLSAFVAMRDATKESEVENLYGAMDDMMFKGIQYFCQLDRGILAYSCYPAAGNERFYDDNVWIGLDMVDWYTETKEMRYLTQAKVVWRYLIDHGWDETCGGGVHWRELNEHTTSKHSCSTGPTAVMGCKHFHIVRIAGFRLDFKLGNLLFAADGNTDRAAACGSLYLFFFDFSLQCFHLSLHSLHLRKLLLHIAAAHAACFGWLLTCSHSFSHCISSCASMIFLRARVFRISGSTAYAFYAFRGSARARIIQFRFRCPKHLWRAA